MAVLLVAGCMELPHPFQHQGNGSRLARPDFSRESDDETAEQAAPHRLTARLAEFSGLPNGGNEALRRAVKGALERRGLLVVGVEGDVLIVPRIQVQDQSGLTIVWGVTAPDGTAEWGQVKQQGQITAEGLKGDWGRLAHDIAEGGADGIVEIVRTTFAKGHGG